MVLDISLPKKMMTTSILHIVSSLLLLPYGLLCVCAIKEKLLPDVSETELGGEEQGTFVAWFDRFLVVLVVDSSGGLGSTFHAISRGLVEVDTE
jgi:hypothetical protein